MTVDMALLQQDQAQAQQYQQSSGSLWPLFLKPGQRAMFRPTLDLLDVARVMKHTQWVDKKPKLQAICEEGASCKYCQEAASNKELKAQVCYALPVYVHGIKDKDDNVVTYQDKDGNAQPVGGMRYLEMSAGSVQWTTLLSFFSRKGTIVNRDWLLECNNAKGKTVYTLTPEDISEFESSSEEGFEVYTTDDLIANLVERYPPARLENAAQPTTPPAQTSTMRKKLDF